MVSVPRIAAHHGHVHRRSRLGQPGGPARPGGHTTMCVVRLYVLAHNLLRIVALARLDLRFSSAPHSDPGRETTQSSAGSEAPG